MQKKTMYEGNTVNKEEMRKNKSSGPHVEDF